MAVHAILIRTVRRRVAPCKILVPLVCAAASVSAETAITATQIAELLRAREPALETTLKRSLMMIEANPRASSELQTSGQMLDLLGRSDQARAQYEKLLLLAQSPGARISAQRLMGVSRGFAGDCKGVEAAEKDVVAALITANDFYDAGQVSDEIGRLCLESGEPVAARKWYSVGHSTGLREENISKERFTVWDFRWLHAQARLAARSGDIREAKKRMDAAAAMTAKGLPSEQAIYIPSLKGYVAFYAGDYATARLELEQAQPDDPFIQCLLGRAWEKLGFPEKAFDRYRFVAGSTAHGANLASAMFWLRSRAAGLLNDEGNTKK